MLKGLNPVIANILGAFAVLTAFSYFKRSVASFLKTTAKPNRQLGSHVARDSGVAKGIPFKIRCAVNLSSAVKQERSKLLVGREILHPRPQQLGFGADTAVIAFALGVDQWH